MEEEAILKRSYSVPQVAEMLGITTDEVYRLIKYQNISAYRGNRRKFRVTGQALKDYIDEQNVRQVAMHDGE